MLYRISSYILVSGLFLFPGFQAHAQTVVGKDSVVNASRKPIALPPVKKPKPITKEISAGLRLNTDGWSFFLESGKVKASDMRKIDMFHDVRILQFEFSEKRHPKEMKIYGYGTDKTYVYGKINNFYSLKAILGKEKMITGKPYPNSISIHWVYAGGLTLGLLKPYYVESTAGAIKYSPATAETFLNPFAISGSSGFAQGIGELKFVPGIHVKTGLRFDCSRDKFFLAAVEIGATGEFYTQKIEMMANQEATPYLFNLYAGVQFGKRRR